MFVRCDKVCNNVVFPAPEPPIKATNSPGLTSNEISFNMRGDFALKSSDSESDVILESILDLIFDLIATDKFLTCNPTLCE